MFKIFKEVAALREARLIEMKKLQALEDYLDIEFFHGDKSKPHYRKKRVIKRPVSRPRKKKVMVTTKDLVPMLEEINDYKLMTSK